MLTCCWIKQASSSAVRQHQLLQQWQQHVDTAMSLYYWQHAKQSKHIKHIKLYAIASHCFERRNSGSTCGWLARCTSIRHKQTNVQCSDRLTSSKGGSIEKRFTRCSSSSSSERYLWLNNNVVWCAGVCCQCFSKNVVLKHMYKAV
jgi:hypothetical protein